jgi:enoyl-CoA hydratase/carnithine racemase
MIPTDHSDWYEVVVDLESPAVGVVHVERVDHAIAVLTFDRPDSLNAVNETLLSELEEQFDALANDASVRVVILTGAGRAFCAGLDLKDFGPSLASASTSPASMLRFQERMANLPMLLRALPQPVIAAVNGAAVGAGMAMALASDLRLCARSGRFGVGAVRIGLSGAEMGLSYHLPRVVGMSAAADLMLTGRIMESDEAFRIGLVSDVVDDDRLLSLALERAQAIVANAPLGVRMTKRVMWANLDAPDLETALELENRTQVLASIDADAAEARAAFLERRPPEYRGS